MRPDSSGSETSIDTTRRPYLAAVAFLGVLILFSHWRPSQPWPMWGAWTTVGLIVAASLAAYAISRAQTRFDGLGAVALPFLLFTIWAGGRTAMGETPTNGYLSAGTYLLGVIYFWLGAFVVRGASSRRAGNLGLAGFFTFMTLPLACHAILQYHYLFARTLAEMQSAGLLDLSDPLGEGVHHALLERRVRSHFLGPNVFCGFLAMTLPLAAATAWEASRRLGAKRRGAVYVAVAIYCAVIVYAAFRTQSAGGTLVMCAGSALIALAIRVRKKTIIHASLFILLFLILAAPAATTTTTPTTASEQIEENDGGFFSGFRQVKTIQQRFYYWKTAAAIWRQSPWTGNGLGSYTTHYLQERVEGAGETRHAHNFIADLAAETGLIGLGLFFWFLAMLARRLVQGVRSGRADALWLGVCAAVALFLIDSLGDITFHMTEVFYDFALLAGALAAGTPTNSASPAKTDRLTLGVVGAGLLLAIFAWKPLVLGPLMTEHCLDTTDYALKELQSVSIYNPNERRVLLDEANRMTELAADWQPDSPRVWNTRARVLAAAGRLDQALVAARKAAELDPRSPEARAQIADCLWRMDRPLEALEAAEQTIALHPLKTSHRLRRADYLRQLGRVKEAREELEYAARTACAPLEKKNAARALDELR